MITRIIVLCTVYLITRLNELVTAKDSNIKPSLTISPAIVIEGNSQTLTCKFSGNQSVSDIAWNVNDITVGVFTVSKGSCIAVLPPNETLYSYTCDVSINTFTLTIKNVKRNNRSDQWRCMQKVPDVSTTFLSSNDVNPDVKDLITSVSMTLPLTSTVTIEENTPQQFQCVTSAGLPEPTVKWYKNKSGTGSDVEIMSSIMTSFSNTTDGIVVTRSTLTFSPTKNDHKSSIFCSAFVVDQTPRRSTRKPELNVLYPPVVGELVNRSVAEGDSLIVSCQVKAGNPPETTFKWTSSDGLREWKSQTLTINKVSRNDSKFIYTCEVENEIQETDKNQTLIIPDSRSFHLNVWYEASVTSFFIEGHRGQTRVTVDENDESIQFTCEVDSNPPSTVKTLFNGEVIKERSNTKQITMILSSVGCLDGGEYTCEANNHHGQMSMKIINLYVNCSPRPLHQMRQNITSALHIPVTLSFTALAYPYPGSKGFAWFNEHSVNWYAVLSNADLHISSSASQSNLTILNVSTADYGRYKLNVTNDHGSFVQYLFLEEDTADNGELSENWTKETENSALITGLTLGVVVIALVVYAASITILYKRKTENKDKQVDVTESIQKTYVNIAYKPDVQEHESNVETTEVNDDETRQYIDLVEYSRDDRTTYEVLKDL